MAGSGSVPKSAMGFGVSLGLYQSLRVDEIVHDLADIPTCLGRIQYLSEDCHKVEECGVHGDHPV